MWISGKIVNLLTGNRDELVKLRTERDNYRDELSRSQILGDWLRVQVNTLQMERSALLDKAYGIKVPVPMLERTPTMSEDTSQRDFSFEDVGDELAKKLGLPTYN